MSDTQIATQPKRLQCRHIFPEGRRCGSPCLHGEPFCYFHHTSRRPVAQLSRRRARQGAFTLPLPEDRAAIQLSIGEILQRVAQNQLDSRRAGLLLYGLQIALQSLPKPIAAAPARGSGRKQSPPQPQPCVEQIVLHPVHGPLAPEAEFTKDPAAKTLEEILLEQWATDDCNKAAGPPQASRPGALPSLQAGCGCPLLSGPPPERVGSRAQLDRPSCPPRYLSRSTPNPHRCKILRTNVQGGQGPSKELRNRHAGSPRTCSKTGPLK